MTLDEMIQHLCWMRSESMLNGDEHLFAYYHDAIQAIQRLSSQFDNAEERPR